ncbi:hypothetical protein [Corynebacterium sp. 13CS0277]|uniref:hypothetical protein n=1 Tax=Corynebacterium sp. 13CS0277 TaxID=2071994 RepID=UPI0011B27473|nr:hypothetical protein [Corynebacterium sp. 13CS0277]
MRDAMWARPLLCGPQGPIPGIVGYLDLPEWLGDLFFPAARDIDLLDLGELVTRDARGVRVLRMEFLIPPGLCLFDCAVTVERSDTDPDPRILCREVDGCDPALRIAASSARGVVVELDLAEDEIAAHVCLSLVRVPVESWSTATYSPAFIVPLPLPPGFVCEHPQFEGVSDSWLLDVREPSPTSAQPARGEDSAPPQWGLELLQRAYQGPGVRTPLWPRVFGPDPQD